MSFLLYSDFYFDIFIVGDVMCVFDYGWLLLFDVMNK